MRSRANFRGHSIHPMLIPFPIAFLVGGLAADVGGAMLESNDLRVIAWYLIAAGVVMALVAAVPGFIDYLYTVPPRSSGKKRATLHMTANLSAVAIFAGAWWLRGGPGVAPEGVLIAAEGVGALLLAAGGWMGGTLAYRNQIGVDHRYAGAGKWKEERVTRSGEWTRVADADELEIDQMKLIRVGGERIVLARSASGYVAFDDHCPHRGGSLAGGLMACGTVTCPWHGSQFEVESGRVVSGPAESSISVYATELRGNEVLVRLPG